MTSSMQIVSNLTLTHGFMVIARYQTKGKGRNNNQVRKNGGGVKPKMEWEINQFFRFCARFAVAQSSWVCHVFAAASHPDE